MLAKLILYSDNSYLEPIELIGYAILTNADYEAYKRGEKYIQQEFMFKSSPSLTRGYEYRKNKEKII